MSGQRTLWTETLPESLPASPMELAAEWLAAARREAAQPNPNAMVLATVGADAQPSARVVLCKEILVAEGAIAFYTNYLSRKGRELAANPRAAVVFHWDHSHRQIRAEGVVERVSDADSDAYFRIRPWQSRLGAWASAQSQPVDSRATLVAAVTATARRFGIPYGGPGTEEPASVSAEVPRPPHWGGYRLRVASMELWVEGAYRIHDRARWTRALSAQAAPGAVAGPWTVTRLQP